jgi:hypothetical protein
MPESSTWETSNNSGAPEASRASINFGLPVDHDAGASQLGKRDAVTLAVELEANTVVD